MNGMHDEREYANASNLMVRAAAAGYNGFVLCSAEGAYWKQEQAPLTKRLYEQGKQLGVELIPHVWSMGYNDGLPYYVPECVETAEAKGLRYRVKGNVATHMPDIVRCGLEGRVVTNNLVIKRTEDIKRDRTYRLTFRVKTEGAEPKLYYAVRGIIYHGKEKVKVEGRGDVWRHKAQELYDFPVQPDQDWKEYHWDFLAYEGSVIDLFIRKDNHVGGNVYFDSIRLEERPLTRCLVKTSWAKPIVRSAATGKVYEEGKDYAQFPGMKPTPPEKGFDISILPGSAIADGEELLVDAHVPAVQGGWSYFACPLAEGLREHHMKIAKLVNDLIHPKHWLLGVDEWRVANRCARCRAAHKTPGQLMGTCVSEMFDVIREVNPKAEVCCWADMLCPVANAGRNPYYCVIGGMADSWQYVPKDLIMVPWSDGIKESDWLLDHGFRCLLGGYYDRKDLKEDAAWRDSCKDNPKFLGMMYTTWNRGMAGYKDLEAFGKMVREK